MSLSELEQDQADFAARASAEPYFADVGVYLLRPRANASATQITQGIENALNCIVKKAGKGGAAVTVMMPLLQPRDPNVLGVQFDSTITVRVQEHPLFNMAASTGTLKSAECIALEVVKLFHHFRNGRGQIWTVSAGPVPNLDFEPKVTYDVTFSRLMPTASAGKAAVPSISPKGGATPAEVTLTCATPGAAIHYTLDGSYPAPDAEGSTLYAAPFTVAAGALLRAVASLDGAQQSDVASALFT